MRRALTVLVLLIAACSAPQTAPVSSSAAYSAHLEGYSGTELCYGCRLEQEVRLSRGRTVLSQSACECSEWVTERVPDHVHEWAPIGCWSDGDGFSCYRSAWPLLVPSEQWLAYVQALPESRRAQVIADVAGGNEQSLLECQAWAAQFTASRSP